MKLSIFSFILFITIIAAGCTRHDSDHSWKVWMMGTTTEIKPSVSQYDLVNYILRQTHEPLFSYDENNRVTSRVLSKFTRSTDYKSFTLCPRSDARFDENQTLDLNDIVRVIESTWTQATHFTTRKSDNCVIVDFSEPRPNFFEALADYSNAPTRSTKDPHIEIGLGPFKVDQLSKGEIDLSRKTSDSTKKFDRIIFKNAEPMTLSQLDDRSFQEFNLLTSSKVPGWVRSEYAAYPVSNLEIYALILNIDDDNVRKAIVNCLDVDDLRRAFFKLGSFHEIGSLFPTGVKGAIPERIHQSCETKMHVKKSIGFLNWKPERRQELLKLFEQFEKKTGIKVNVQDSTVAELAHKAIDLHSGYDLTIISMRNERTQMADFLEMLVDPHKIVHSVKIKEIQKDFEKLKDMTNEAEKEKLAIKINDAVLAKGIALPLFQPVSQTYYPKNLKSLQFGSSFNQYPEVDGIQ